MAMTYNAAYLRIEAEFKRFMVYKTPSYDQNGNYDEVATFVADGKMVAVYTGGVLFEV